VLIAAGRVRQPGERRGDLYKDNADTVRGICAGHQAAGARRGRGQRGRTGRRAHLLIQEELGFARERVLGVGGLLSSTRIRYLVSAALGISPREVTAQIIGPHRQSMVVLQDSIRVSGIPAVMLLGRERLAEIIEEAREAGDVILEMAQSSTSLLRAQRRAVCADRGRRARHARDPAGLGAPRGRVRRPGPVRRRAGA
jgi:malate dehydrogenase